MFYEKLSLVQPTPVYARNTCGPYWYIVQSHGGTPHTAFCTREAFLQWLEERGLELTEELAEHGTFAYQNITGSYAARALWSYDKFFNLDAKFDTRVMSNGEYTLGRVTEEGGLRVVNYMNVNCKYRPKFDYHESRARYG